VATQPDRSMKQKERYQVQLGLPNHSLAQFPKVFSKMTMYYLASVTSVAKMLRVQDRCLQYTLLVLVSRRVDGNRLTG